MNGDDQSRALPSLPASGAVLSAVILLLLTVAGAYLPALTPLTTVLSGAIVAGMLLLHRSLLSVLAPFVCAALGACIAKNGTAAVLALLFLPIGFCAAFSVYMRLNRMTAIAVTGCATALVGTVSLGASVLASGLTVAEFFDAVKRHAVSFLTSHTVLTETGTQTAILTEESAEAIVSYVTLLLPALLVCLLFLLAYAATGVLTRILSLLGALDDFLPGGWLIMPSRLNAIVYLAVQPITFLCAVTSRASALYYGFYNVSLVFLLPLAILGLKAFVQFFRHAKSLGGTCRAALVILFLMTAAAGLYWLFTFAAFFGVYIVFRVHSSRQS